MMKYAHRAVAGMLVIATCACSTHPRSFKPELALPASSSDVFTRDLALCNLYVDRGIRSNFAEKTALLIPGSAGTVVLVGAAVNAALSNTISAILLQPATASAGTLSVAAPFLGMAISSAAASAIKHGKEKKLKAAMTTCLSEFGYAVKEWKPNTSGVTPLPMQLPQDPIELARPNEAAAKAGNVEGALPN